MNSRRLTLVLVRTAAFLVVGIVVFTMIGWSWFGILAVALIAAAMAVQLGGVLWLRRTEQASSDTRSATTTAHGHSH